MFVLELSSLSSYAGFGQLGYLATAFFDTYRTRWYILDRGSLRSDYRDHYRERREQLHLRHATDTGHGPE